MRSVLIHNDDWKYTEAPSDPKEKDWDANDAKALATITLCLKTSQLCHISDCETTRNAWKKLNEVFEPKGPATVMMLTIKMEEGEKMSEFLKTFSDLVGRIKTFDEHLSDGLLATILLNAMPKSYENFKVAIITQERIQSLDSIKNKLIEESIRRNSECPKEERVFYQKRQDLSRKEKKPLRCFKCHKTGHFANKCPMNENKKTLESGQKTSFGLICAYKENMEFAWVLDSGATCHVCCKKEMFSELSSFSDKLTLADGSSMKAEQNQTQFVWLMVL